MAPKPPKQTNTMDKYFAKAPKRPATSSQQPAPKRARRKMDMDSLAVNDANQDTIDKHFVKAPGSNSKSPATSSQPAPTKVRRKIDMDSLDANQDTIDKYFVKAPGSTSKRPDQESLAPVQPSSIRATCSPSTPSEAATGPCAIVTATPPRVGNDSVSKDSLKPSPPAKKQLFPSRKPKPKRESKMERKAPKTESKTPTKDWKERWQKTIGRFSTEEYLVEHHLKQLRREQTTLTAAPLVSTQASPSSLPQVDEPCQSYQTNVNPMSEQQKQVAEHPPDIPLSVRAGAGTGKTHTMVTRTIRLVTHNGLDPARILLLTFTKKAAGELCQRVAAEFDKILSPEQRNGFTPPTSKTFHSLAYKWVRQFWKKCGLGKYPSLLVAQAQKKQFMCEVIKAHVKHLQLKRCRKLLRIDAEATWETVMVAMRDAHPKNYERALTKAKETCNKKTSKDGKPPKKTNEAEQKRQEEELKILARPEIERQCYLELLQIALPGISGTKCDLESKWVAGKEQCKIYLKLVENARLGQHRPDEYLPDDAEILKLYERTQEHTGQLDFDKLLQCFVDLLRRNESIREAFHRSYDYVIVDEYQDNSEVQSELLLNIVTQGRVTVVGDDDQCIYEFRGASPGNFDSFQQYFSSLGSKSGIPQPEAKLLENNYRSTGNILEVGDSFLQDLNFKRGRKTLLPTREPGEKVEFWDCWDGREQAKAIALSVKNRHDNDGVAWGEMACLLRCFRLGPQGLSHTFLQEEFAKEKVPFQLIGGESFLNSEVVRDVLAYMSLALTGSRDRTDDGAFARVLNKPARGLPKEALVLIKAHQSEMNNGKKRDEHGCALDDDTSRLTHTGLEEAATLLVSRNDNVLSRARTKGMEAFFGLLERLRVAAVSEPLETLVLSIWNESGLAASYWKKEQSKDKSKENETGSRAVKRQPSTFCPKSLETLMVLAKAYREEWEEKNADTEVDTRGVESLFNLTKKCLIERAKDIPIPPQCCLPQPILDELHMPGGIGLPVLDRFMADLELQIAGPDDEEDPDRVTISTIHRAKGLEWKDVYIPFFNEGAMPTTYREESSSVIPARHQPGCRVRTGSKARCWCAQHYANVTTKRRQGLTPEQRHIDEERRLAHVAATRARDRLVFLSVKSHFSSSSLRSCLQHVPSSAYSTRRIS